MEEGERLQRRRARGSVPPEQEDVVLGETFFRTSLILLAAVIFSVSFASWAAGGRRGHCPRGFLCVAVDSTLPPPPSIIDTEDLFDGLGQVAHEDPNFVPVGPTPNGTGTARGGISRVFTCGINAWLKPAVELLFPEFGLANRLYNINMMKCRVERVLSRAKSLRVSVEDSLLVVRPTIEGVGFVNESAFPGKVLYINTENGAYPIPQSQYGLGPYRDTNHTMRLYLASLYLNTLDDDLKSLIVGRPDNDDAAAEREKDDDAEDEGTEKTEAAEEKDAPSIMQPPPLPRPTNTRENFALFVASSHCSDLRLDAVRRLSLISTVHVAGHCVRRLRKMCRRWGKNACSVGRNQRIVPINVTDRGFDRGSTDVNRLRNQSFWSLHEYYSRYRFAMVFENRRLRGYVTEKIVNALLGGAVPIYYGTKDVFKIFNRDAMVFFNDTDPGESIERISYLEGNETAYDEVAGRPILADGKRTVAEVFSLNDTLGKGMLKSRIRRMVLGVD